jgi:malonate decarboxylase delta subunit
MNNGMETLHYELRGSRPPERLSAVLVGVVASGNLEVLIEAGRPGLCEFHVETSARGFGAIWEAVIRDFQERHDLAGAVVSIHDMGATPAVVSLRLEQAVSSLLEGRR